MILKPYFLYYSSYQVIIFLSSVHSHPSTDGNYDLDPTQYDSSELTFPPDYLLFSCRLSANMNRLSQHWKSKETLKHIRKEIHLIKASRFATDTLMEIVSELAQTMEHEIAQTTILMLVETTSSILSRVTVRNFEYLRNYYKMFKKNPGLQKALLATIQELVDIFRDPLDRRLLLTLLMNVQIKQISNQKAPKSKKALLGKGNTKPELEKNTEPDGDRIEKRTTDSESEMKIEDDLGLESLPTVTDIVHEDQNKNNVGNETFESLGTNDSNLNAKKIKKPTSKQKGTDPPSVQSISAAVDDLSEHHSETDFAKETGKNVENEKQVNEIGLDESLQELALLGTDRNDNEDVDKTEDLQERSVTLAEATNLDKSSEDLNIEPTLRNTDSEIITGEGGIPEVVNDEHIEENESNVLKESITITNNGNEENEPHGKKSTEIEPKTDEVNDRNIEPIDDEANENIMEKDPEVHQVDNIKNMKKQVTTKKKTSGGSTADLSEAPDKVEQDNFQAESSDLNNTVTTHATDLDTDQDTTSADRQGSLSNKIADNESSTINYENEKENMSEDKIINENDHSQEKKTLEDTPKPQENAVMRNDDSEIVQNPKQSELDQQNDMAIENIKKQQETGVEAPKIMSNSDLDGSVAVMKNSKEKYISNSRETSQEVVTDHELMSNLVSDDSTAPAAITDNKNRDAVAVDEKQKKGRKSTEATPPKNEIMNTSTHDLPTNEQQIGVTEGIDSVKMEELIVEDVLPNEVEDNASKVEIQEKQFQRSNVSTTPNAISNPDEDLQEEGNKGKYASTQSNNILEKEVDSAADLIGREIKVKSKEELPPLSTKEEIPQIRNSEDEPEIAEVQNESGEETFKNISTVASNEESKMKDAKAEDTSRTSGIDAVEKTLDAEVFNTSIDTANKPEEGNYSEHKVMQNSDIETIHVSSDDETPGASAEMVNQVEIKENLGNVSYTPDDKNTQKISEQKNQKKSKIHPTSTKSEETTKISDHDNILTNDNKDQSGARVSQSVDSSAQKVPDNASKEDGFSEIKARAEVHDDNNKKTTELGGENISGPLSKHDTSATETFTKKLHHHSPKNIAADEVLSDDIIMTDSTIHADQETLEDKVNMSKQNDITQKSIVEKEIETVSELSDEEEFDYEDEYELEEQISDERTNLQPLDEEDDEDDSGVEDDNDVLSVEEGITDVESEEMEDITSNLESMFSAEDIELKESKDGDINITETKKDEHSSGTPDESKLNKKGRNGEHESGKVDTSRPTKEDDFSVQPLSTEASTNDLGQTMVPEQISVSNDVSKTPSITASVERNHELTGDVETRDIALGNLENDVRTEELRNKHQEKGEKMEYPKLSSEFNNEDTSVTEKLKNINDSPEEPILREKLKEDKGIEDLAFKGDPDRTNIKADESKLIDQCIDSTTNFDHSIYKDDVQNVKKLEFKEEDGKKMDSSKKIPNAEEVQLEGDYENINQGKMEMGNSQTQPQSSTELKHSKGKSLGEEKLKLQDQNTDHTSSNEVNEKNINPSEKEDKESPQNLEETNFSVGLEDVYKTGTQDDGDDDDDSEVQDKISEKGIGNGNVAMEEKDTTIRAEHGQISNTEIGVPETQICEIAESGSTVQNNALPQKKRFSLKNYFKFLE